MFLPLPTMIRGKKSKRLEKGQQSSIPLSGSRELVTSEEVADGESSFGDALAKLEARRSQDQTRACYHMSEVDL